MRDDVRPYVGDDFIRSNATVTRVVVSLPLERLLEEVAEQAGTSGEVRVFEAGFAIPGSM